MIIDIIVIILLLISAGIAFFRGFIREVLTIFGVVGGLIAAYYGGSHVTPVFESWLGVPEAEGEMPKLFDLIPYDILAAALAYGAIFIVVVIILSVISHMLSGWARKIGLGAIDRTLGVIFGVLRGIVILALLYLPVSLILQEDTKNDFFKSSKTHIYIDKTSQWLAGFIPEDVAESLNEKAEETSESVARTAREKVQDMDILDSLRGQGTNDTGTDPANSNAIGYERDERLDLHRLFDDVQDDDIIITPTHTDNTNNAPATNN